MSDASNNARRCHVLHLIGSTGLYGAERWILALMRSMDRQRFEGSLINLVDAPDASSPIVEAATARGLRAFDFVTGGRFNIAAVSRLAAWVREQKVDIIHGHGFKSDLLGLLAARLAGRRMMSTPHGWSLEKDIKLMLYEKLDRYAFRHMDMVCPLSDLLYQDALRFSGDKTRLIGNGVDLEEIRSSVAPERTGDGSFVIGYIGRMVQGKDIVTLIKAIPLLLASGRRIKVVLVGDGDQLDELKALSVKMGVSTHLHFTGFQSDTGRFLRGFDCFVLPSLSEGTPRCIMEAMALNIPVAASDIPGNRLLVSHEKTGLLFPVGDVERLAQCVLHLLESPERAREMAGAACAFVEECYSSKKMASEYASVYEELLSS